MILVDCLHHSSTGCFHTAQFQILCIGVSDVSTPHVRISCQHEYPQSCEAENTSCGDSQQSCSGEVKLQVSPNIPYPYKCFPHRYNLIHWEFHGAKWGTQRQLRLTHDFTG